MRMFSRGKPFMDVEAEGHIPDDDDISEMRTDAAYMRSNRHPIPVFSEMFLYPRLGKDDARFVLAIADEYSKVISILGADKVEEMLRAG
jgi:hypothetical protein